MARVVILGAGVSGHTMARYLSRWIGDKHEVVVVSPNADWNWIPSNIWVGVGEMTKEQVTFDLEPVYKKAGVNFHQAKAISIHPEGSSDIEKPYVVLEYTSDSKAGEVDQIEYDFLVNATGPKLNFGATEGLGPDVGFTTSVCTPDHAIEANEKLNEQIEAMKKGEDRTFVIGTGHGMCTCQGAAFEYLFNVEYTIRNAGVRDKARIIWVSNEYELGDFGMGGVHINRGGYITNGKTFAESLMVEFDIEWITRAHVNKIDESKIYYENLDGEYEEIGYDFTMLIPPFAGVGLLAYNKMGDDITDDLFAPNKFLKVDADYNAKPFEEWSMADWPKNYQNPTYKNLFAVGIAFAPPHLISKPMSSPNGTPINPTPPRTGMPSAAMAKTVAKSIRDMLLHGATEPTHEASMGEMGAACVVSTGSHIFKGSAATMTVYPVVPDYDKYPDYGRDMDLTFGEIGLAGHWMKYILHHAFIYQAKMKPGWSVMPD